MLKTVNKGTGAGGKNTNVTGKSFEMVTCARDILLQNQFIKTTYISKIIDDKEIIYTSQNEFKKYVKDVHNIISLRIPDEAYIIKNNDKITIKILEKKNQTTDGSVETKLWASSSLKREYQIHFGDNFTIEYALCVNSFLKDRLQSNKKKYQILKQILNENDIHILYGNDNDYFDKLIEWIHN